MYIDALEQQLRSGKEVDKSQNSQMKKAYDLKLKNLQNEQAAATVEIQQFMNIIVLSPFGVQLPNITALLKLKTSRGK